MPWITSGAGIQKQDAVVLVVTGHMCVAEDDHVGFFISHDYAHQLRRDWKIHDMMNQEFLTDKSLDACLRKLDRVIRISEYCAHGRNGLEFSDHIHWPHVTRVQNMVHASKRIMNRIGHVTMRVRNDADLHMLSLSGAIPTPKPDHSTETNAPLAADESRNVGT